MSVSPRTVLESVSRCDIGSECDVSVASPRLSRGNNLENSYSKLFDLA